MDLVLARLLVTLRLTSPCCDPYVLFAMKGLFARAFSAAVCSGHGDCGSCPHGARCPYPFTFAQALAVDPLAVKRYQKPSLPFVFQIPVLAGQHLQGHDIKFGIVLVGQAITYVDEFCTALQLLFADDSGKSPVPAHLVKIESIGCTDFRTCILSENGQSTSDLLITVSSEDLLALNTRFPDRIDLRITTPLRIMSNGQPLRTFSFSSFIRCLMRRISSLAYYYAGTSLSLDWKRLAALSTAPILTANSVEWVDWNAGRLAGLVGTATVSGDLEEFFPLLLLGELLNCGKDAPYGCGGFFVS
jgi:hypothetical protein